MFEFQGSSSVFSKEHGKFDCSFNGKIFYYQCDKYKYTNDFRVTKFIGGPGYEFLLWKI